MSDTKAPRGGFREPRSQVVPTPFDLDLEKAAIAIEAARLNQNRTRDQFIDAKYRHFSKPDETTGAAESSARAAWEQACAIESRARVTYTELSSRRSEWLRAEGASAQRQPLDR